MSLMSSREALEPREIRQPIGRSALDSVSFDKETLELEFY